MKLQERIKEYKEHAEKLINDELKTATERHERIEKQKELALIDIDYTV